MAMTCLESASATSLPGAGSDCKEPASLVEGAGESLSLPIGGSASRPEGSGRVWFWASWLQPKAARSNVIVHVYAVSRRMEYLDVR
jgi:hypothetical protein